MDDLSDKDMQEFKEIFDLVDTDHSGVISLQELRRLMASLYLRPTEQELAELFEEAQAFPTTGGPAPQPLSRNTSVVSTSSNSMSPASITAANLHTAAAANSSSNFVHSSSGSGASRKINFAQFASIMARRVQSEYSAEQLRGAFQLFESPDMPEGFVSSRVLAHALMTYGSQNPTESEVERLIATVDPEHTGRVNYYDFVDMVTN